MVGEAGVETARFATGGVVAAGKSLVVGETSCTSTFGAPGTPQVQVRYLNPSPKDVARYIEDRMARRRLPRALRPSRFPRTPIRP